MKELVDTIKIYQDVVPSEINNPNDLIDGSVLKDEHTYQLFLQYSNSIGLGNISEEYVLKTSIIKESIIKVPTGSHWIGYINHKDEPLLLKISFNGFVVSVPPKAVIMVPNHPIFTLSFAEVFDIAQIHYSIQA